EVKLTPRIASQAQRSVATEQTIALLVVTGGAVKAAFQLENRTQAVAQIFRTTQSPAVTRLNAVANAGARVLRLIASGVTRLRTFVTNTSIDNPVQGYRRFCLGDASKADGQSSSEQSLFHLR